MNIFEETNRFLTDALKKGNVLVHCFAGISRSATVVIAFLMKYKKMNFEEAFEFTKQKREIINPNFGF
jgi:protein-tyrosine phosphatase